MLFIGKLCACVCECFCVWKHAEGTSIIISLWISTEGVERRGDEERLPSALLPLGVKQHTLLGTYITQQIKNGLWGWSRPPQQPPPAPPNNTTCATTAEHSSQLYAWSCYSFITSRRPLTQRPDVWGFFSSNGHLAPSVLNFLRPVSPSYLSFVSGEGGRTQSMSAKCGALITFCWIN